MGDSYQCIDQKVIIRLSDRVCETSDELLSSDLFKKLLTRCIRELSDRNSRLLDIFGRKSIERIDIEKLIETLKFLSKMPHNLIPKVVSGSDVFFRNRALFFEFIEYFYNYWRNLKRLVICESEITALDKRPYRTFNDTVEKLMHVVRSTYRDIQENISAKHPRIYRQVSAGAEIGSIALPMDIPYPDDNYKALKPVSIIRQTLIYPPLIFNTPMNKRTGMFEEVDENPLKKLKIDRDNWLCYPAKVGPLTIMIYFSMQFFEMGFALCNLFELASSEEVLQKPDAVMVFGFPGYENKNGIDTVFYDDKKNDILVGVVPGRPEFGYFGYLKKMILTLHNIKMMQRGWLPFHGALVKLFLRNQKEFVVLMIGDSGAGKSETLEALRIIGDESLQDMSIIADDMGSIRVNQDGEIYGYGTEIGAFVRLDDLQPGFAFGQIDRTIIMNPNQTNARVVLPVTSLEEVTKGHKVDFLLYANNYEKVDESTPAFEQFKTSEEALETFREGKVMSKGTTTTKGIVGNYFANVFGPPQFRDLHEKLAVKVFSELFEKNIYVGQMRTQLGIPGFEMTGPENTAQELLELLKRHS